MGTLTQHRTRPFTEIVGLDYEKIFAVGGVQRQSVTSYGVAGTSYFYSDYCPANEIWVVQIAVAMDMTSAIAYADISIEYNGALYTFVRRENPSAGQIVIWSGNIVLFGGERVCFRYSGTAVNDMLYNKYHAYKMTAL